MSSDHQVCCCACSSVALRRRSRRRPLRQTHHLPMTLRTKLALSEPSWSETLRKALKNTRSAKLGQADWEAIRSSWMVRPSGLRLAQVARNSSRAALHWQPRRSHSPSRVYWRLPVTKPVALRFPRPSRSLPSNPIHCPQVAPHSRRRRTLTAAPPNTPLMRPLLNGGEYSKPT